MSNAIIKLENVSKSFGEEDILENFSVEIGRHEFVTILGPSGCGKTTTLRLIGGFERPDSGRVLFDGEDITNLPPYKRRLNTVFQKYALFPHMNVFDNVAFGLSIKKIDKEIIREKVSNILKLVNLSGFEKRNIASLSGGQQHRIVVPMDGGQRQRKIQTAACRRIKRASQPSSAARLGFGKQQKVFALPCGQAAFQLVIGGVHRRQNLRTHGDGQGGGQRFQLHSHSRLTTARQTLR